MLIGVGVIKMAKRSKAGTNVEKVRQQNQAGLADTEFASETDAAAVRQANQQSKNAKSKNK